MTLKKIFKIVFGFISILIVLTIALILIGNIGIKELPISKTNADNHLRIVSMNVSADNILSLSFQDNLIDTKPDIIVVIEWTGKNLDLIKFQQAGYLPILDKPRKKVHGICILSKIGGVSTIIEAPIETPCTLPLGQFRFNWHNKNITLFAIHAPPPVPACKGTTSIYLKSIADWSIEGNLSSDLGVGKAGDHLILAGDFNSLPFDSGIEKLRSKQLQDNYSKSSFTSPTWSPFKGFPYIAKIDYILFSSHFKHINSYRFKIDNSDHTAIMTDLTF